MLQHQIAGVVTKGVVDFLKQIQVHAHQREQFLRAQRARQRVVEPVVEQGPIRQLGQRIMHCLVFQLLVGVLHLHSAIDYALFQCMVEQAYLDFLLGALSIQMLQFGGHVIERQRGLGQLILAAHIDPVTQIALGNLLRALLQGIQTPRQVIPQRQGKQSHQQ